MPSENDHSPRVSIFREAERLRVCLDGEWLFRNVRPDLASLRAALGATADGRPEKLAFEMDDGQRWDTSLLTYLTSALAEASDRGLEADLSAVPKPVRELIDLSQAVPVVEVKPARELSMFEELGTEVGAAVSDASGFAAFLGELMLELGGLFKGKKGFRRVDFMQLLQNCGPQALPIVSLLSFLTGLIIAFIGLIQLQRFAADVYVADLVAVATTRELGAVIAGVIMAGRTGASFAAQLGSMQVNEEIDALTTFGVSPMRFLVVPRVIALVVMMPLLVAFADIVSIFAGLVVALGVSDIGFLQYREHVREAVDLWDLSLGIFKGGVFGFIIAVAGCYRGLNSGKDAASVGMATTSAVVLSITWICIADAIFAVLCNLLGI